MENPEVIKDLRVHTLQVDRMTVEWRFDASDVEIDDYDIVVERSGSPQGNWTPVSPTIRDHIEFVDVVPVGNRQRQLWYRLQVTHRESGDVHHVGPSKSGAAVDLIASYVRRHQQLYLERFVGRRAWVLKKRTYGTRCHTCFDITLNKRLRSGCPSCYDTGFLRGYWQPIEVWLNIPNSSVQRLPLDQQIQDEGQATCLIGAYPVVSVGDIIVEAENLRWRVLQVSNSRRLRARLNQTLTMRLVEDSEVEYTIPIAPEKLDAISAPTTFTNPTCLTSEPKPRT